MVMETNQVRNAFSGIVEDVRVLTAQRNELVIAMRNLLAIVDRDDMYLDSAARPGETVSACSTRLVREARALLARPRQ